jgi:hypothetical protein
MRSIEILSLLVLSLTFFAILWYSWETHKLRIETAKQTRLRLRPMIILAYIKSENGMISGLCLSNIGNGIALNVKLLDIYVVDEDPFKVGWSFDEVPVLPPNKSEKLIVRSPGTAEPLEEMWLAGLEPDYADKNFGFVISYSDIDKGKYCTNGELGKDGINKIETKEIEASGPGREPDPINR